MSAVNPMVYSLEEIGLIRGTGTDEAHRAIGNAVHVLSGAPLKISAEVIAVASRAHCPVRVIRGNEISRTVESANGLQVSRKAA